MAPDPNSKEPVRYEHDPAVSEEIDRAIEEANRDATEPPWLPTGEL